MRIKREDVDRGRAEHHEVPIVRVQPLESAFALNRLLVVHACYLANTCERNLLVIFLASALARNPVHILVKLLVRHLGPREEKPRETIRRLHVYGKHKTVFHVSLFSRRPA